MHTSRFLLLGGLTFVGALLSLSAGCGDDDGGSGGATSSSSSSSGGGGKGGDGQGGNAPALSCDDYCATITTNCAADADKQFKDTESCLGICKTWGVGTAADTSGNTLGCHTYHAGAAAMDATLHCPHAGPAGAGKCGDIVSDFCEAAVSVCEGSYQDVDTCKTDIAALEATTPYNASATSGDTLACRLYHLTVASSSAENNTTHCPHVAVVSAPCVAP